MEKPIDLLKNQLKSIHFGNITPGIIDTVKVSYYDQLVPVGQIANTQTIKNNISVVPYEPDMIPAVNKVLISAGFNSYIFSKTTILVSVPPPSLEEKNKINNYLRKLGEEAKIAVRNIRKKIRQPLDKEALKKIEKELQAATDVAISEIDTIIKNKIESL